MSTNQKDHQQLIRRRNLKVAIVEHKRVTQASIVQKLKKHKALAITTSTISKYLNLTGSYDGFKRENVDAILKVLGYSEDDIETFWTADTNQWRRYLRLPNPTLTLRVAEGTNFRDLLPELLQHIVEPFEQLGAIEGYEIDIIVDRVTLHSQAEESLGAKRIVGYLGIGELTVTILEQPPGTIIVPKEERARYQQAGFPEVITHRPGKDGEHTWRVMCPDGSILGSYGQRISLCARDYTFRIADDAKKGQISIEVSAHQPFAYTAPREGWKKLGIDDKDRCKIESIANAWIEEEWPRLDKRAGKKAGEKIERTLKGSQLVLSSKRYVVD